MTDKMWERLIWAKVIIQQIFIEMNELFVDGERSKFCFTYTRFLM